MTTTEKKTAEKKTAEKKTAEKKEKKEKKLPEIWLKRKKAAMVTIGFVGDVKQVVYPGTNRIDDQEVLRHIANDKYNRNWNGFFENKIHELVSGKNEKTKSDTTVFTAMASSDCIVLIKETYSVPALEKLFSDEQSSKSRQGVLTAIEDQIADMKAQDTKPKESN